MLDYDQIKDKVLKETSENLSKKNKSLGAFVHHLFGHSLSEDLAAYSSEQIADFTTKTFQTLQKRKTGRPQISFRTLKNAIIDENHGPRSITTIDIINDNMPFLIDSLVPELRDLGYEILLLVHPIFSVKRDEDGTLIEGPELFKTGVQNQNPRESVVHIHIPALTKSDEKRIREALNGLLKDVRTVVNDWPKMMEKLQGTVIRYKASPPPIEVQQLAEAIQFLEWLMENNFTFLGVREYRYDESADRFIQPIKGSGLGILHNPDVHVLKRGDELVEITPEIRAFMTKPDPLIISKANVRSRIHRRIHMDYIGVKLYDAMGTVTGELRLIGLFTSTVYAYSINAIPYLRHKANKVMEASGFDKSSHSGKALWNVLESYPRDELFHIGVNLLEDFALSILALDGRAKVRVLPRWDKFDRYVSILVFVPRDRYNTDIRIRIGEHLATVFKGGVSSFYPGFPEGLLARVHFIIRRDKGKRPEVSRVDLESAISAIVETWDDRLENALDLEHKEEKKQIYRNAFSAAYREAFKPEQAVKDIAIFETLQNADDMAARFYNQDTAANNCLGLKLFKLQSPIDLSLRVPMLEFMGFKVISERTFKSHPEGQEACYLHDMVLEVTSGNCSNLDEAKDRLQETLLAIWQEKAGNDGYNALALNAGLNWCDIALLRTISRYLQQVGVTYSQQYMWKALNSNSTITTDLVSLFYARFDPKAKNREKTQKTLITSIHSALENVSSLDEDQIIRRFKNVIIGTKRTNFFKRDESGHPIAEISLKLAPREIDGLPEPRPFREIFMSSPRVEGLHLRFGKVARGGLRWSDRPEDFRTEVLGLVKAQQVKNAVIVPVGSKGGFVPKKLNSAMTREEYIEEGTQAYKIFIENLLEITDNLEGDKVIPPKQVVRHDEDDPYLVVAADKGTATFSDTANNISQSYDFWLDDAFASGGSAGYDHKKMGITARGAWEAVKRHFREIDKDIQSEPFTAAGVGDMSGDVFGNGMLLSKATKVVAAFDHRDIFIDPDPDPKISYKERKRLFDMGRSSWQDYDKNLLSKGGGIFSRALKSIALTEEMQKLLGIKKSELSPYELMQAIVKMDVELFWFGGIGTYIRSQEETNAEVGDRANDLIRITADEVRAKVIGEGANLGMTQRARIAYNKRGGRSNSDAIDNSAGVNSSDVEVNIKIALGAAVRKAKLNLKERNTLLEEMTDEVADLVLRNNYQQTLSISLTQKSGMADFDSQVRVMHQLEKRGLLNRDVEDLPSDGDLEELLAQEKPLTRAEIGVILAYVKITLFDDLIDSTLPDDPYLERELLRYFPKQMQENYADEIKGHKLRREIIATLVCNAMINRGGATYLEKVQQQTSANSVNIAKAYILVREAFDMQNLHARLDALDTKIKGSIQLDLYERVRETLLSQTIWVLKNVAFEKDIATEVANLAEGIKSLTKQLKGHLPKYLANHVERESRSFIKNGVPKDIAEDFALLPLSSLTPNIIKICKEVKRPLIEGMKVYFELDGLFEMNKIDALAAKVQTEDYYDTLALNRGRGQLNRAHSKLARQVLENHAGETAMKDWHLENRTQIEAVKAQLKAMMEDGKLSVARVSVAANLLEDLTREQI